MSDESNRPSLPPCMLPLLTRRKFLERGAVAAAALPLISATACEFTDLETEDAASSVDFDVNEAAFAPLTETGGWAVATAGGLKVLLIRDTEDNMVAYSHLCPHQNLPLAGGDSGTNRSEKRFAWISGTGLICAHHGANYNEEGTQTSWPDNTTPKNISSFDVTFDKASGKGTVQILKPSST